MNYSLCPYKFIFGKPKEGIHSYRIFDFAIADVLQTLIFSYILSLIIKEDFKLITIIMFLLGIILHRLFCVETTIDKLLFK
jgi:hypothetical protein